MSKYRNPIDRLECDQFDHEHCDKLSRERKLPEVDPYDVVAARRVRHEDDTICDPKPCYYTGRVRPPFDINTAHICKECLPPKHASKRSPNDALLVGKYTALNEPNDPEDAFYELPEEEPCVTWGKCRVTKGCEADPCLCPILCRMCEPMKHVDCDERKLRKNIKEPCVDQVPDAPDWFEPRRPLPRHRIPPRKISNLRALKDGVISTADCFPKALTSVDTLRIPDVTPMFKCYSRTCRAKIMGHF